MNEQDCRNHPLWNDFWEWAETNDCDSPYMDDWQIWWECFIAGGAAVLLRSEELENEHAS